MLSQSDIKQWATRDRKLTKRELSQVELEELRRTTLETADNLFEMLLRIGASGALEAAIPECMLRQTGQLNPVLMFTENGLVRIYRGSHAFNKFFEIVDLRVSTLPEKEHDVFCPQYLVLSRERTVRLCMTKEECITLWKNNDVYLARRFIKTGRIKPTVFRVNFQRDSGTYTVFSIKNATKPIYHHNRPASLVIETENPAPHQSIYQHDIFSYVYAGKLLKSSFTPYHPYPSLLSSRLSTPLSQSHSSFVSPRASRQGLRGVTATKSIRPSLEKKSSLGGGKVAGYLVDTWNLDACKVYQITERVASLELDVAKFVKSLEKIMKDRVVKEIDLDFVQASESGYMLVDLKSLTLERQVSKSASISSLRDTFRKVTGHSRSTPMSLGDPQYLPLSEQPLLRTASLMVSPRYSTRETVQAPDAVNIEQFVASELLGVEAKYDSLMGKVRRAKVEAKDLVEELDSVYGKKSGADALVDRFFHAFIARDEVNTLYENKMKQDFEVMKAGIISVLRGQTSLASRRHIKKVHQSVDRMQLLVQVFSKVAAKEAAALGFSSEHCEMVAERLSSFLKDLNLTRRP